jgi:hypothetical protein
MLRTVTPDLEESDEIKLAANVLPIIDVDGTLLDFDGPRIIYCDFLIDWLKTSNIKEIILLTNMNMRELYFIHPSRYDLIQYLAQHEIKVRDVVTPLDVVFMDLKITHKMGDLYERFFRPIESALSHVKQCCDKDIFTQFSSSFMLKLYKNLKYDSCHNFQPIFESCLSDYSETPLSKEQLSSLTDLFKEFFIYNVLYHTFQIDPRSANKGEAHIRYMHEHEQMLDGRPLVFIDDTEKERVSVYDAHQNASLNNLLLVMPAPSDHKNQVTTAWERVHEHSAKHYVTHQEFSNSISSLCQLSLFKVNQKKTYTANELHQETNPTHHIDNDNHRY